MGAALLVALAACSAPEQTLVAYDGPRLPPAAVARIDEGREVDTLDVGDSGSAEIVELDGLSVNVPFTLELLPGEHELLIAVEWNSPADGRVVALARLRVTLEAGQHCVARAIRKSTQRLFAQVEDVADGRVLVWAPAE
jgi:hypothetical protein